MSLYDYFVFEGSRLFPKMVHKPNFMCGIILYLDKRASGWGLRFRGIRYDFVQSCGWYNWKMEWLESKCSLWRLA